MTERIRRLQDVTYLFELSGKSARMDHARAAVEVRAKKDGVDVNVAANALIADFKEQGIRL